MNIKHNPPRRTALIWGVVIAVGLFLIFLPGIIGMDVFNGGFALSFLGGFIAIIGLIAMVIYLRMAGILDRITKKENVLAYWKYTPEEWKQYTEQEPQGDILGRRNLFFIIAVISIFVGIIFWFVVRDHPLVIVCIILGIIAITGITTWTTGLANYQHNKGNLGEVYIALDGVFLNRQLHIWKGIGNKLEEISFDDLSSGQSWIKIGYSSPSRNGPDYYSVQIPVPPGQEDRARKIVAEIAAAHLVKSKLRLS
jgi:hypothetical protein